MRGTGNRRTGSARRALHSAAALLLGAVFAGCEGDGLNGRVQTVTDLVRADRLGRAMTHEHVMIDWIGADRVSADRYDADEVFAVMLPHLAALRAAGVAALFDNTPPYLGRDPEMLRRLADASGVKLVGCTGLYHDQYIPGWAQTGSVEQIAAYWIGEARDGMDGTGVKPGFIKIAMNDDGGPTEVHLKLVRAAARASRATGLPVAIHNLVRTAPLQELDIFEEEGVPPSHVIMLHADAFFYTEIHQRIAARGAWLSYDQVRPDSAAGHVKLVVTGMKRWPNRLLFGQDAGWYTVGAAGGGSPPGYTWLVENFLPMLREAGLSANDIDQLMRVNPARAFSLRPTTRSDRMRDL